MADNDIVKDASSSNITVANDDIAGVKYPRFKMTWGPDGTANDTDVATGKPIPVQLRVADGTAFTYNAGAATAGTQRVILASDSAGIVNLGLADADGSMPVVIADMQAGIYENVNASASAQICGTLGGAGDWLDHTLTPAAIPCS